MARPGSRRTCPSTVGSTRWWRGAEAGRRLLDEAMQRIAQMGPISRLHFPTCLLAEADLLAGHPEDARHRLTTLLGDRQTFTPVEHGGRGARLLLAWAEMALGRHEAAEALLNALLLSAPPFFRVDALRIQGLLAIAQQRWDVGVARSTRRSHSLALCPTPMPNSRRYGSMAGWRRREETQPPRGSVSGGASDLRPAGRGTLPQAGRKRPD